MELVPVQHKISFWYFIEELCSQTCIPVLTKPQYYPRILKITRVPPPFQVRVFWESGGFEKSRFYFLKSSMKIGSPVAWGSRETPGKQWRQWRVGNFRRAVPGHHQLWSISHWRYRNRQQWGLDEQRNTRQTEEQATSLGRTVPGHHPPSSRNRQHWGLEAEENNIRICLDQTSK